MIESYNTDGMFKLIMLVDDNAMPIYTYFYGRDYYATFNCRTYHAIRLSAVGTGDHTVDMKIAVDYGTTGYYYYKHMYVLHITP